VAKKHTQLAKDILDTCVQMYKVNPTNLAPEICYFNIDNPSNPNDIIIHPADTHNLVW
jgi:mannosyl-oligosaccharide alpha-1,2-mannosidase